jgi:nucleoid-associated protein YgaU
MAVPPAGLAMLGAFINASLAPFATQAQLGAAVAPLATQAQLGAAVAPLATQAQLAAAIAPLATQAQLAALAAQVAALPAQIQAVIAAALAPHNAPAIAAAAAAIVQSICASRMENSHDRSGVVFAVVQRADGTPPPNWPAGFDRDALISGPVAVVDTLLGDFGLPNGPPIPALERRNALALHIGTMRV